MLAGEKPQWVLAKLEEVRQALNSRGARGYWEAELQLSTGEQNPPESYARPFGRAIIYSRLQDKDRAIANLKLAYAERDTQMTEITIEPQFDPLRSDPRFADLERRVGIPRKWIGDCSASGNRSAGADSRLKQMTISRIVGEPNQAALGRNFTSSKSSISAMPISISP